MRCSKAAPRVADAFALIPTGLKALVQQARQADPADKPAIGLLRSGADIVVVAVTAILPPPGSAEPPPPAERSVLIFGKRLAGEFLDRIGSDYLLSDISVLGPDETATGATLPLIAPDGERLGQLAWMPDRPGRELLRFLLPPLAVALVGLAAFAWLVLHNARRSASAMERSARTIEAYARTLESSEARFRDVAEASSDWIWETDRRASLHLSLGALLRGDRHRRSGSAGQDARPVLLGRPGAATATEGGHPALPHLRPPVLVPRRVGRVPDLSPRRAAHRGPEPRPFKATAVRLPISRPRWRPIRARNTWRSTTR